MGNHKLKQLKKKISVISGGVLAVLLFSLVLTSVNQLNEENLRTQVYVAQDGQCQDPMGNTVPCDQLGDPNQMGDPNGGNPPSPEQQECMSKGMGWMWNFQANTCEQDPAVQECLSKGAGWYWDGMSMSCKQEPTDTTGGNTTGGDNYDQQRQQCQNEGYHWDEGSKTCDRNSGGNNNGGNPPSPEQEACMTQPGHFWDYQNNVCKKDESMSNPAAQECMNKGQGWYWDGMSNTCKQGQTNQYGDPNQNGDPNKYGDPNQYDDPNKYDDSDQWGEHGAADGECPPDMTQDEWGGCMPKMSEKDKEREFSNLQRDIDMNLKQGGGQNMWLKDFGREISNMFGVKLDKKSATYAEEVRALIPEGSETAQIFDEMMSGQGDSSACWTEKQNEVNALRSNADVTFQDIQEVRDGFQDCWDNMGGENNDPRWLFESMQELRMCADANREIENRLKFDIVKNKEKELKKIARDLGEAAAEKAAVIFAETEAGAEALKAGIAEGDCEDWNWDLDDLMRGHWEKMDEFWRSNQGSQEVSRFKKESEFIKRDLQKALSAVENEYDKKVIQEGLDLIAEFQTAAEAGEYDEAMTAMEDLRYLEPDLRSIAEGALMGDSEAYNGRAQFDRFKDEFGGEGDVMAALLEKVEAKFGAMFEAQSAMVEKLTARIEQMQAKMDEVISKAGEAIESANRIGQRIGSDTEKFNDELQERMAERTTLFQGTQEKLAERDGAVVDAIAALQETLADEVEDSGEKLDSSTEKDLGTFIKKISEKHLGENLANDVVVHLTEMKDAVRDNGLEALNPELIEEGEKLFSDKDLEEKNKLDLVEDKLIAGKDVNVTDWYNQGMVMAKVLGAIEGRTDANGNPLHVVDPIGNANLAEAAKIFCALASKNGKASEPSPTDPWYDGWVACVQNDLGFNLNGRNPWDTATRADIAELAIRAMYGNVIPEINGNTVASVKLSDVAESHGQVKYIIKIALDKIMIGDDTGGNTRTFRPDASINRAEIGQVVSKIADKLGLIDESKID